MKIQISPSMDTLGNIEDKLIRLPRKLREQHKLELGEFVTVGNIILQVAYAYVDDWEVNAAKVTTETFNRINTNTKEEQNLVVIDEIMIGCDPEFFIVDTQNNCLENPANYFKKWNRIGYDGLLGELRPQPHDLPEQVVLNLQNMIIQVKNAFNSKNKYNTSLFAASSGYDLTAGFHCHMGIPKKFLNKRRLNYKSIISFVVKALDYHVGTLAVIPEGELDNKRRCMPFVSYGKVSDHRIDNRTLEYRVPGGTLLKTPDLTKGLLSLCKLVCTDALTKVVTMEMAYPDKHFKTKDYIKEIYPYIPNTKTLYQLICTPNTALAEKEATFVADQLTKMDGYANHAKAIKKYMYVMTKRDLNKDIFMNWRNYNG